jgi:hypothetical protein
MNVLPSSFRAGDTVSWTVAHPDYPASAGWSLNVTLAHPTLSKLTLGTTAVGDAFLVSLTAATTAAYAPGQYAYLARVSKGADTYTLDAGSVTIEPDLAAATTYDGRTWAQRMLDAIQAALEGRASSLDLELEIQGRRIRHFTPAELITWHSHFQSEVAREQRTDRLRRGLGTSGKVLVRL